MRTLVWHWGRRGAGPIFAARLTTALRGLPGEMAALSLPVAAELLAAQGAPACDWAEPTYETRAGYFRQRLLSPFLGDRTRRHLRALRPDIAICAMPALLDARMLAGLQRLDIPYAMIVHDATAHPGDGLSFRALGQGTALRGARHLFCLSGHVEAELRRQGLGQGRQGLTKLWHPPLGFAMKLAPAEPGVRPRLLHFGRLLPYKGLDLLAEALALLGPDRDFELRICGEGPRSATLARLAAMDGVDVENRWFSDAELPGLLAWAGGLVLPYREASQSGVAAMAIAAGRQVLATNVGGLPEQLGHLPAALLCAPEPHAIAQGLQSLSSRLREVPAPEATADSLAISQAESRVDWQDFAAAMLAALV
ncbi:glycosyltransferase [Acidocella sp.]|uniref:glycosyltransferase n=1 Tax=Acidocella sp. TaxID=50710 RepID=UPI00261BCD26|nr:glycosyltransferase [Acidocella sp.]